jgi:hypothetical protein
LRFISNFFTEITDEFGGALLHFSGLIQSTLDLFDEHIYDQLSQLTFELDYLKSTLSALPYVICQKVLFC